MKIWDEISETNEGGEVVSPVGMWLDSINHVFEQMKADNFPFDKVVGISGSCVVVPRQKTRVLRSSNNFVINSEGELSTQLKNAFSWDKSPNWQDHSTNPEGKAFVEAIGREELAEITGSRDHLRFTGLQIRKFSTRSHVDKYAQTSRISLVSSFVTSVLLGEIDGLEESDACGMNLYDLKKGEFNEELLALAAGVHPKVDNISKDDPKYKAALDDIKAKLGEIKPITYNASGKISSYFTERYGFSADCKIYSFTGDNLATILSLPLQPNDCLLSLGTSTTVLLITNNYEPSSQYHLFKHPTMPNHYMGMICYCNGSLARERVRDEINEKYNIEDKKSWDKFNEILEKSGKFDNKLGIFFPLGEIVPHAPAQTVRAVLEDNICRLRAGPMLSKSSDSATTSPEPETVNLKKVYSDLTNKYGELYTDGKLQTFQSLTARPNRCYYVGGTSNNLSIISKMGSILGPVNGNYKVEIPNACALGGAYKASWSYLCEEKGEWINYDKYINQLFELNNELDTFEVEDKWVEYFDGVGLLAKMEENLLKH
ncbi:xkiA [[Candida] subhashii]|uniref:XkiA n=1 Tax=[Candida] subhashii TaxID=561895 RepID=A0A8J5QFE4_9ASCO|nr:xkiA [[Candida] subhashii]KAG7661962.1 xkiA [[Candida] subhashii]